uniref:Cytosolic acyl coenzyme A thioester hydrolase-like n=1 Tax=Saccoglossus kowalevskii TaxID=10224 RepID=A0ABM0LW80_SACKO|nr:PREDICTED: cytosolic acyl coenzyme A thioester hydrolase-like [Saccoglossus kowalevskii]
MALWNTRVGSAFRILRVATTGKYDYVKTKTHVHFSIKPRLIAQTIRGYMAVAEPPDFISDPKSSSYIQVSRIMSHDDANPLGNIHGGILLRMIAEAGYISATKYFNSDRSRELPGYESCSAALARAERTSFLQPMFIGELAQLHAEVMYTSKHSLEVQVQVFAENILEGTRRLTNKASLWFVPVSIYARPKKILEVAEMNYKSPEIKEQGRQRYEFQLSERVLTHKSKRDVVGVIFNSNFGAQKIQAQNRKKECVK